MFVLFEKDISKADVEKNREIIKKNINIIEFNFNENLRGFYFIDNLCNNEVIESLVRVRKVFNIGTSYKFSSREFKKEDTIINLGKVSIGGENFVKIAGPCSFEGEESFYENVEFLKKNGCDIIRGGAFKPRTSPYFFQGMGESALKSMKKIGDELGVSIVSEIVSLDQIDMFCEYVDIIQVGARNMQNYELLKKLGKVNKPVLLKRGFSATVEELLLSSEYIILNGNLNVILCERGIRTFEKTTRNTLDVSAIAVLKKISHLPIIVDPSHASGVWDLVEPLALAGVAAGADGVLIEVHNDPENALSDGMQSLKFNKFKDLSVKIDRLYNVLNS